MSVSKKIILHLGKNKVKFDVVEHKKVFTAYDLAQTLGEKLENIAKSLLIEAELPELKKKSKKHFVVVVPASYRLELDKIKKAIKASKVSLAPEKVMKKLGIEPGALSPFGSLKGFNVLLDQTLLKTKGALVGAESFTESLRLKMKDFAKLESAMIGKFGKSSGIKLQKHPTKKKSKPTKKKTRPVKKAKKTKKSKR